ncbi:mandelate racemase/muconate lactonizing enzyme family protein [Isoptericola sp. BMS4]|uniref:mandelate racemase/muconate lactonizing enzyme family protein n=1 Tax=Isoptericola sp. BMS4 TaxID=2527875 RepID=UPI00141F617D|nr:enolase C-terminal domain-like protein [Isoptericola sp. BMS4]
MARVTEVRTHTVAVPLPEPLRLGAMTVERREYVAVEVLAERAPGETPLVGVAYALTREAPMAELVERLVAPHVVGREIAGPADVRAAWDAMLRGSAIVGRVGLVRRAIGLVDVALWDVAGQAAGLPVWRLLGADDAPRPSILVAAYPTPGRTADTVAAEVLAQAAGGWPLLKISRSPDRALMREVIARVRDGLAAAGRPTVPGREGLVVDVGFGWRDADEALADLDGWGIAAPGGHGQGDAPALAWLEDPLLPEDAARAARIRAATGLPLSIGDEVTDPEVHARLAGLGALDVPRVDVVAIGGLTPAAELVRSWLDAGLTPSSHVYPEVSVHLGIGVETFDRSPQGNPYDPAPLLVTGGPTFADGYATPPPAPGLGFRLSPRFFPEAAR